jgi:hypothetical protein
MFSNPCDAGVGRAAFRVEIPRRKKAPAVFRLCPMHADNLLRADAEAVVYAMRPDDDPTIEQNCSSWEDAGLGEDSY